MKRQSLFTSALVLSAALLSAGAQADTLKFAKSEDAIKYRQNALFLISQHFGSLGAMANGRAEFNAQLAQQNAAVLETLSSLPWQAFGAGTEGGKAKPEIWKEKTKFDEDAKQFEAEAAKLVAAAKTGDLAQIKAAFGPTAQTCKTCHEAFRNR